LAILHEKYKLATLQEEAAIQEKLNNLDQTWNTGPDVDNHDSDNKVKILML
jgi:hypothetical protein